MSKKQQLRELQQRQAQKQRRTALGIGAGLGVLVLASLALIIYFTRTDLPKPIVQPKATPSMVDDPQRAWGPKDAPIKVVEYMDYQCPTCGNFARFNEEEVVKQFAATGKVRYEVRYYPVVEKSLGGRESTDAAQAAMCAGEQGRFWPMHSALFQNQFGEAKGGFNKTRLKDIAAAVEGVEAAAFAACLDGDKYRAQVQADAQEAVTRGVSGTPSFFVNGNRLTSNSIPTAASLKQDFARIAPNVRFD